MLSVDLWQAADFQAANCRAAKHLPLHQPMFPALPPPLRIIGKECRFYQETDAFADKFLFSQEEIHRLHFYIMEVM